MVRPLDDFTEKGASRRLLRDLSPHYRGGISAIAAISALLWGAADASAQSKAVVSPSATSIRFAGQSEITGQPASPPYHSLSLALQPEELTTPAPLSPQTLQLPPPYQPLVTTGSQTTQPCDVGQYPCYEREYSSTPFIARIQHRWHTQTKPWLQATHWGYPENFDARPFGSYTLRAEEMQIINGLRDQQVLYRYDFTQEGDQAVLSPRGEYQLRKILERMVVVPGPIVIESTVGAADLDEARRQHVIQTLQAAGFPIQPEMVVVDRPALPGLQGLEALIIHQNLLQQTQRRGAYSGGGSGAQFSGNTQFGGGSQ